MGNNVRLQESVFWLAWFLGHGLFSYLWWYSLVSFSVLLETDYYSVSQMVIGALTLHQIATRHSLQVDLPLYSWHV